MEVQYTVVKVLPFTGRQEIKLYCIILIKHEAIQKLTESHEHLSLKILRDEMIQSTPVLPKNIIFFTFDHCAMLQREEKQIIMMFLQSSIHLKI